MIFGKKQIKQIEQTYDYEIVDSLLLTQHDWSGLYQTLKELQKPVWQPREKILIAHPDTEFFVDGFGFSIYNFNQVIRSLDIDPSRFIIVTNHRGSTQQWQSYCDHPNNQFHIIETPFNGLLYVDQDDFRPIDLACDYHFGCMIGVARVHRMLFAKFFVGRGLVNKSISSINLTKSQDTRYLINQGTDKDTLDLPVFLTTSPKTGINEYWKHSKYLTDIFNSTESIKPIKHESIVPYTEYSSWSKCNWYKNFFVDVVTETVFNYPYAYISEKIMRSILIGRPFILFGAPNTLTWLKELGFKTFSDFWDESYDLDPDPNSRFEKLCNLLLTIDSWSIDHCRSMLKSMTHLIQHNQNVYQTHLREIND